MVNKKHLAVMLSLSVSLGLATSYSEVAHPVKVSAYEYKYEKYQLDLLAQLNFERKMVGLDPVKLHPLITKAAVNHANYLKTNGYALGHGETKGEKGFTGVKFSDRIRAAGYKFDNNIGGYETITSMNNSYTIALKEMLHEAPFHRDALLSMATEYVGFGYNKGGVVVTNAANKLDYDYKLVYYPYNGQTGVSEGYYGNEDPDPLMGTGLEKSGTIITFTPFDYYYLGSEKISLKNASGQAVPFIVDTMGTGTIRIIPKKVLQYNSKYTVSVSVVDEDTKRKASKTWSFTTRSNPYKQSVTVPKYVDYKSSEYWSKPLVWAVDKKYLPIYAVKNSKTSKTDMYLKPSNVMSEEKVVTAFTKYKYASEYSKTKSSNSSWAYSVGYQLASKYKLPTNGSSKKRKTASATMSRGDMIQLIASAHYKKTVSEQTAYDFLYKAKVVTNKSLKDFNPRSSTSRALFATYLSRYDNYVKSTK